MCKTQIYLTELVDTVNLNDFDDILVESHRSHVEDVLSNDGGDLTDLHYQSNGRDLKETKSQIHFFNIYDRQAQTSICKKRYNFYNSIMLKNVQDPVRSKLRTNIDC